MYGSIVQSISSRFAGRSIRVDSRILLHTSPQDRFDHSFVGQHEGMVLDRITTMDEVEGFSQTIRDPDRPMDRWRSVVDQHSVVIAFAIPTPIEEAGYFCTVVIDWIVEYPDAPTELRKRLRYIELRKYTFRKVEGNWVIEEEEAIVSAHGPGGR